jgi:hypothetical protein
MLHGFANHAGQLAKKMKLEKSTGFVSFFVGRKKDITFLVLKGLLLFRKGYFYR